MSSEQFFRSKSPEQLEGQVNAASAALGAELVPPSEKEGIFLLSLDELKEKYPVRYQAYVDLFKKEKNNLPTPSFEETHKLAQWITALNALDSYIDTHKKNGHEDKETTLREHQVTVFESLRTFLETGGKEGYIKLPTGYGKTVIFTEFLEATNLKSLIVVPRKLLVEQTESAFAEFAEDIDVGKIYSEAKEHGRHVTITTYDSFVRQVDNGTNNGTIKPEDYDCLILDEAHRSLSDKRIKAVGQFGDILKLGFTATPTFAEHKKVANLLETEIHSVSIAEAVEEGAISPFSVMAVRTSADLSNVRIQGGDYDEGDLMKAVNIESRNLAAIKLCKELFVGQQTVAYCVGVEHAEKVASMLNAAGVPAASISGMTPLTEQRELKRKLASGELQVLCNADILIEGFDVPETSVCLNLRPTLSRVIAEQRGGRALRLDEKNPQKHAIIFEFLDKDTEGNDIRQILFSMIAEGAFFPEPEPRGGGGGGGGGGPRDLPDIEGLDIIYQADEIMRVTKEMKDRIEVEPIPDDWLSCHAWAIERGDYATTLKKNINRFLKTPEGATLKPGKPNVDGNYAQWVGSGGTITYYSLEFRTAFEAAQVPKNWLSCNAWASERGGSDGVLKRNIDHFLKTPEGGALKSGKPSAGGNYAEWVGPGGTIMYYSLEFRTAFEAVQVPKNWLSCNAWAIEQGGNTPTLKRNIDHFLKTPEGATLKPGKPNEGGNYAQWAGPGGTIMYYSLEFRTAFEAAQVPNNWLSCTAWSNDINANHKALKKKIDLFLQTPEGAAITPGKSSEGGNYAKYPGPSGETIFYSLEFRTAYDKYIK